MYFKLSGTRSRQSLPTFRFRHAFLATLFTLTGLNPGVYANSDDYSVVQALNQATSNYEAIARQIWNWAEVGYQEHQSSALLQRTLSDAGFRIEAGVADIPTAFVATYGQGEPVIGILAEFDALPGITQSAAPTRDKRSDQIAGHACGHHLFGTASSAAAIAVRHWLEATGQSGTIRLYGTPAEEGGSGKVYMVRAGLFDDVDTVLHWHAADRNMANPGTSLANKSARIRYTGQSSHAAAAPERGRSALDGVEALNFMVNLMREHVPQETRIHYVITDGGKAPNVVPDFAEVYYYIRHPDAEILKGLWDRVMTAAEAAAMGTGTRVAVETMHGNHSLLPNEALAKVMHKHLSALGGYELDAKERAFAERIQASFGVSGAIPAYEGVIQPFKLEEGRGSTDVGDVSWVVPTTGLTTATWVSGTSAHSWQAIAAGGMSIGTKGMMLAAKTLALTAQDLFEEPSTLTIAREEFDQRRGPNFKYEALLGDRAPPLDYRGVPKD